MDRHGAFRNAEEVLREALQGLGEPNDRDHEAAANRWLTTEVIEVYDRMRADPSRGISVEQAIAELTLGHHARSR